MSMSELQDKLDRGEITPQEFFDAWDAEMEENELLHPGIHDWLYEYLKARYPGPGVDADDFLCFRITGPKSDAAAPSPAILYLKNNPFISAHFRRSTFLVAGVPRNDGDRSCSSNATDLDGEVRQRAEPCQLRPVVVRSTSLACVDGHYRAEVARTQSPEMKVGDFVAVPLDRLPKVVCHRTIRVHVQ